MLRFLYRMLTRPQSQDELTTDMIEAFEEARVEARKQGALQYFRFAVREIVGQMGRLLGSPGQLVPRSFWVWSLGGAMIGLLMGWTVWIMTPHTYTSTATLVVRQAQIPLGLIDVEDFDEDFSLEFPRMRDSILSRNTLTQIIRNFELYSEEQKVMTAEDVIELMRENIRIEMEENSKVLVAFSYRGTSSIGSTITNSFFPGLPDVPETGDGKLQSILASLGNSDEQERPREGRLQAQRVTQDLVGKLIEQNYTNRGTRSYQIAEFFKQQLDAAGSAFEDRIVALDGVSPSDPRFDRLELERDLARDEYVEMSKKYSAVQMYVEIQDRQQGTSLAMLDSASLPTRPDTSAGEMAVLGAGEGTAVGLVMWLLLTWRGFRRRMIKPVGAGT